MQFREGEAVYIDCPLVRGTAGIVVGPDEEFEGGSYLVCVETGLPGAPGDVVSIDAKSLRSQSDTNSPRCVLQERTAVVRSVTVTDVMNALQGDDRPAPNNTAFVLDMCLRMLQDS